MEEMKEDERQLIYCMQLATVKEEEHTEREAVHRHPFTDKLQSS